MIVTHWFNFIGSAVMAGGVAGVAVLLVPGSDLSDGQIWAAAAAAAGAAALNHIRQTPFPGAAK